MGSAGHSSGPMDGYRLHKFIIIHSLYLRDGPAHIVQRPTGKTPGAPDGQSATAWMDGYIDGYVDGYIDRCMDAWIDGWMDGGIHRWID